MFMFHILKTCMTMRTETISIGSIGFAQLGEKNYPEKRKIERSVLYEVISSEYFDVPELLRSLVRVTVKKFYYEDMGSYDEVVLLYNTSIDLYEDSENEEEQKIFNVFVEFLNKLESFDFESEELLDKCRVMYFQENQELEIIHGDKQKLKIC